VRLPLCSEGIGRAHDYDQRQSRHRIVYGEGPGSDIPLKTAEEKGNIMTTTLATHAKEQSTYSISASFTDEDDEAVAPKTLSWTLTDISGTVINERENVNIPSPSASEDIVLSGADLALQSNESTQGVRVFTVEGTYDSDAGSDLPLNDEIRFIVDGLVAVS
jgi:hypothetical protein